MRLREKLERYAREARWDCAMIAAEIRRREYIVRAATRWMVRGRVSCAIREALVLVVLSAWTAKKRAALVSRRHDRNSMTKAAREFRLQVVSLGRERTPEISAWLAGIDYAAKEIAAFDKNHISYNCPMCSDVHVSEPPVWSSLARAPVVRS